MIKQKFLLEIETGVGVSPDYIEKFLLSHFLQLAYENPKVDLEELPQDFHLEVVKEETNAK